MHWEMAFAAEAHLEVDTEQVRRASLARREDGRTFVWSDADADDAPVCLVGHTPMIAGVPRVGPVYTPPEHRSRGYASSAVAALSRRLFADGARQLVLFTDLANPTSNKIYAEVGYRRIADFEIYAFTR
jgi:predicted GNAT family acetyltransferase